MRTTKCDHLSCQLPDRVTVADLTVHADEVFLAGHVVASVRDDGYRTHSGEWHPRWVAFMGGNAMPLPQVTFISGTGWARSDSSMEAVLSALLPDLLRVSFHNRLALHPHSRA